MGADLKRLDELYAATTQGPWHRCQANEHKCPCGLVWSVDTDAAIASVNVDRDGPKIPDEQKYANGDFIAASHDAWSDISRRLALLEEFYRRVDVASQEEPEMCSFGVCEALGWLDDQRQLSPTEEQKQ